MTIVLVVLGSMFLAVAIENMTNKIRWCITNKKEQNTFVCYLMDGKYEQEQEAWRGL